MRSRALTTRLATLALAGVAAVGLVGPPAWADSVRDSQWQFGTLKIADAHRISQGEGVTVAVVDTGVDGTHPDLAGAVDKGTSVLESGKDGWADDTGHGTAIASIIAGRGHGNGDGILGIAPKAKILPVKVSKSSDIIPGASSPVSIADGLVWAVDHGAKVVAVAMGGPPNDKLEQAARYAWGKGVVVVAATGNDGGGLVLYPAAYDGVVAVSGVDRAGNHDPKSNTGRGNLLTAPSTDIPFALPGGKYGAATGTSTSTGIVAGVAALIRSKFPSLPAAEVYRRLTDSAIDQGKSGFDLTFGHGVVNPVGALAAEVPKRSSASPSAARTEPPAQSQPDVTGDGPSGDVAGFVVLGICLLVVIAVVVGLVVWLARRRRRKRAAAAAQGSQFGPGETPFGPGGTPPFGPGGPGASGASGGGSPVPPAGQQPPVVESWRRPDGDGAPGAGGDSRTP